MYEAWAQRRRMRARRLASDTGHLLVITGIGAYRILSAETGLHVFESPHGEQSFDRATVHVTVAPSGAASPESDPAKSARLALAEVPASTVVVRRYRANPSPLVRDAVRNWRTGRLDRVLAGEFDVMADT
jgi:ATP-dependent Clp protease ATP-binding subunit ClpC